MLPLQKCIPVMLKLVLKKGFIILQSLRRSITVGKKNKKLELFMLYVAWGDSKYADERFAGLHAGGKISKEKLTLTCDQMVSPE